MVILGCFFMNLKTNIRLQKYMASCGLGSRRFCEKLILSGRVKVNNVIIKELGTKINPSNEKVECNGKILAIEPFITFILNKPIKTICSSNDPQGRKTVLTLLDDLPERVYTIGRLDYMSEGLILITNEGELAHMLMHPKYEIKKIYNVWIKGTLTKSDIKKICIGIQSKGEILKFLNIEEKEINKNSSQYIITLKEGKNRHIRRVFEFLDKKIIRLQRISIGPIELKRLKIGEYRQLKPSELKKLRQFLLKKSID